MKRNKYEEKILEAYIATPAKYDWYRKAFDYFSQRNGKMSWYWSTWAFLGGFWYFLYRKQLKMATIVLFVIMLMSMLVPAHLLIPSLLFLNILIGGFGSYFVYKSYIEKRMEVEKVLKDDEERIRAMKKHQLGGINKWVIPVAVFALVSLVLIIIGLIMAANSPAVKV